MCCREYWQYRPRIQNIIVFRDIDGSDTRNHEDADRCKRIVLLDKRRGADDPKPPRRRECVIVLRDCDGALDWPKMPPRERELAESVEA